VNTAVNTAWTYLVVAGLFEIGWPLGLKWAQQAERTPGLVAGVAIAIVAMGISGFLLYLAQREMHGSSAIFLHGTVWPRRPAELLGAARRALQPSYLAARRMEDRGHHDRSVWEKDANGDLRDPCQECMSR
jgi:hypothetical protein